MDSTMQDFPLTIASIVRHGVTWYADSEVLTATETGLRRSTFADIGARAARLANALRSLGVTGDQVVGTFCWNNQEHLEAYLAVPSMGAVLHTLNIRLFPDQVSWIANHAQDLVVIVDASLVPVLAKSLADMQSVQTVLVTGPAGVDTAALSATGKTVLRYEEVLAAASTSFEWVDVDERSAAAMCYTSGTTGSPKGVVYSHRSTYLHSLGISVGNVNALSFDDRALVVVPMFHANAWGLPYAALMHGCDLVMPDRFLQPEPLVRMIEAARPTLTAAVPTIWNDLLRHLRENPGHDLSSFRLVLCGGSAVPRTLIEAYENEIGVTIMQGWGMTETSPVASVARPPRGATGETALDYRSTAGRLLFGVEGRLVGDDGSLLPADGKSVGELEVRGPWVTARYHKEDDPAKFHDGWLRTGDVGALDPQGYFTISDRSKDVIKSGGEWISSVDLENTLMGHPEVAEAAVVGVVDEEWGERPLAAVVRTPGSQLSADDLRRFLGEKVAKWWVPERWTFVDAVPRTSVGKFDKKVIRRQYADGELAVEQTHAPSRR